MAGARDAHPDNPDRSRLVGIGENAARKRDDPDHPDPSRPDDPILRQESRGLRALRDAWRTRWTREDEEANAAEAEAAEAAAMAAHYAAPAAADAYRPGDPDPLRDGLLRGFHDHRRG